MNTEEKSYELAQYIDEARDELVENRRAIENASFKLMDTLNRLSYIEVRTGASTYRDVEKTYNKMLTIKEYLCDVEKIADEIMMYCKDYEKNHEIRGYLLIALDMINEE